LNRNSRTAVSCTPRTETRLFARHTFTKEHGRLGHLVLRLSDSGIRHSDTHTFIHIPSLSSLADAWTQISMGLSALSVKYVFDGRKGRWTAVARLILRPWRIDGRDEMGTVVVSARILPARRPFA